MCTAIAMNCKEHSYFGRNMDIPFFFNQHPILIPKAFSYLNRAENTIQHIQKTILGMGAIIDGHPAMADAMNENGLACAGLNFAGYACFDSVKSEEKDNVTPYDFILWALSGHDTVEDIKNDISSINLVSVPINGKTPVSQLHWMLSDKNGNSVVVECTEKGLNLYDNPVGVMTNNPEFPWHLTNLREYMKLSSQHPSESHWSSLKIDALGVGAGSLGLPGDYASVSRFVRAAFSRANTPAPIDFKDELAQFFHELDSCAMPKGCVKTINGEYDFTTYSSCMDLTAGVYYYKCYENNRLNAVKLKQTIGSELIPFPYNNKQDINYLN